MALDDGDILARTLYGEARGEYAQEDGGLAALIGVANVVMNRFQQGGFGLSVAAVCLKHGQFSCWNPTDPNYPLLQGVIHDPMFALCQSAADGVLQRNWPDLTKGSNFYHSVLMPVPPKWARNQKPKIRLGHHVFYLIQGDTLAEILALL